MPETGKVIAFPVRRTPSLDAERSRGLASDYLNKPLEDRSPEFISECLSDPDCFLWICSELRDRGNVDPSNVLAEASALYKWVIQAGSVGVFDEGHFFVGESAFRAGAVCRLLGRRDEAELWLDRAEARFRHTLNPAPLLANIAFERLALHYSRRNYERVMELLPSLAESFRELEMKPETRKCAFLEAITLKDLNRPGEARARLEELRGDPDIPNEPALRELVLVNLGELASAQGNHRDAISLYREALSAGGGLPLTRAHLKVAVAEGLRHDGRLVEAADSYRAAAADYVCLEMMAMAAYVRVLTAETLIAATRHREAEWEILAALPTIEEQKMVPEGFAAVALLKESVRRRKTDPNALRELREQLQVK